MTATALAERTEGQVEVHPASDGAALMQMIERVATNPDADISKLERLVEMHERITDRTAKAAFAAALSDMQPELPVIIERGEIRHGENKPVQSRYALWEDINEAIRPILAKHGFALSFRTGREADRIIVTGILSHRGGHSEETTMHLPADQSGSKNAVQAVGSSTSYGKRYTAMALLNITTRGEDDDGKAAGIGDTISDDQHKALDKLMDEVGADVEKFLAYFKVEYLADLPAAQYDRAVAALEAKRAKP